jgi:hypothetical protein
VQHGQALPERADRRGRPARHLRHRRRRERLLRRDRERRRLGRLLPLHRRRLELARQPRAGLSGGHVGGRHRLAGARLVRRLRRSDPGVRQRRPSVLRVHLLQPREARERRRLRRAVHG